MKRIIAVAGCALLLSFISSKARAITINGLATPTVINLPADGIQYSFKFVVQVTPGLGEAAGGLLPIVFQDSTFNTQFDWANLNVRPNQVNKRLTFIPSLFIGCTNSPTPNVMGPLGQINNAAVTATYFFPTLNTSLGSVKINCITVDPNSTDPPLEPSFMDPDDFVPSPGSPGGGGGSPGDNNLLPANYLNAGSGVIPTDAVPEPGTAWLVMSGFGTCATMASRRRKSLRR